MENSLDFLQSEEWHKFQESTGKRTFHVSSAGFWANIIEHTLPVAGKYFYVPRGPVIEAISNKQQAISEIEKIINLARKENVGWARFDANSEEILKIISKAKLFQNQSSALKIKKAPHDMQPREIFVIDITKTEEELLNEMKSKTRYNIKLAEKRGVKITSESRALGSKYIDEFLKLVNITAKRDGITPHPENYYRKMFEIIPENILKLYVAEYGGKIIAANLVIFYRNIAIYLHGASDNEYRNVMAPYLLQWRQIQDAKNAGCTKYDFGGVKTNGDNSWTGITKFKTGFSENTKPVEFPGSYDIVINPRRYYLYRLIQSIKRFIK